jgi:hypothetical protein
MATKSKIVTEAMELFETLPDLAKQWFESLKGWDGFENILDPSANIDPIDDPTKFREKIIQDKYLDALSNPKFISKLTNTANEYPQAFNQYESDDLFAALDDAGRGYSDLALMDPKDFKELASKVGIEDQLAEELLRHERDPYLPLNELGMGEHLSRIINYSDRYKSGLKFDDVPFLTVDTSISPDIVQTIGHEGRHRMRGQERLKYPQSLVRINPGPKFDEDVAKREGHHKSFYRIPGDLVSDRPEAKMYTELSGMQSAEQGGGKEFKSVKDVLKFLSTLGVLAPFMDDE